VLHVRTGGDAASVAPAARREVRGLDPTLSVFDVRTLEEQVSQSLAPLRINVIMLGAFGTIALLLASVGLYGVASYSVTLRTREIGVRMALGARRSSVLGLVLGRGLIVVAIGIAIGLAAAAALAPRVPANLLPNVNARDPLTFATTALVLVAVALIANYLPARRATRIDPLIALRGE
jgi:ABC-type antimicrobial peptide transport system permease subunit